MTKVQTNVSSGAARRQSSSWTFCAIILNFANIQLICSVVLVAAEGNEIPIYIYTPANKSDSRGAEKRNDCVSHDSILLACRRLRVPVCKRHNDNLILLWTGHSVQIDEKLCLSFSNGGREKNGCMCGQPPVAALPCVANSTSRTQQVGLESLGHVLQPCPRTGSQRLFRGQRPSREESLSGRQTSSVYLKPDLVFNCVFKA